jgi:hypothetical protein
MNWTKQASSAYWMKATKPHPGANDAEIENTPEQGNGQETGQRVAAGLQSG